MEEKPKNYLIALRYLLGLGVLVGLVLTIVLVKHAPPTLILLGILTSPLTLVFVPPIATALYLMFSSKIRWRVDLTLLLITILCPLAIATMSFGGV